MGKQYEEMKKLPFFINEQKNKNSDLKPFKRTWKNDGLFLKKSQRIGMFTNDERMKWKKVKFFYLGLGKLVLQMELFENQKTKATDHDIQNWLF